MLTLHSAAQEIEREDFSSVRKPYVPPADKIADQFQRIPARTLRTHEQLFGEGTEKASVYEVMDGAFVLYRLLPNGRRQVTGFALAGDFIGLGAGSRHNCTAESAGPARVRALPASTLNRLAREDSAFGLRLYDAMSRELASAHNLLMTVSRLNAAERVATFLLGLSERNVMTDRPAHLLTLPMTRCDIADFLGLTTETVSRVFTKLDNIGAIARHPGEVRILDADALEDVASGSLVL